MSAVAVKTKKILQREKKGRADNFYGIPFVEIAITSQAAIVRKNWNPYSDK